MTKILQWFHDTFSTLDDSTPCPIRIFGIVFAVISTGVFMWLSIHTVYVLRQPLDYGGFAGGLAAVWGTVSLAIVGKRMTEKSS